MADISIPKVEEILKDLKFDPYDKPFDPYDYLTLQPGQQPTKAQIRNLQYHKLLHTFKGQDQYIFSFSDDGPTDDPIHCVKIVPAKIAATMLLDRKARMASDEEVERYQLQHEKDRQDVQKKIDRVDLGKALERTLRD